MQLDGISVFIKVVQAGSFNRAAQLLAMPNSTVSAKVASLEKELGVTLLQRTTRKLNITQAGQAYYERCVKALADLEMAEQEIKTAQKEPMGTLKITAPTDFGQSVLPMIVREYRLKFPKVNVELLVTNRLVDLLAEGVDLAIRAGELEDSSFISKRLGIGSMSLWASPSYIKKNGEPKSPKELSDFSLIGFSPLAGKKVELQKGNEKVRIEIRGAVTVDDTVTARTFAVLGEGIALLPKFLCDEEVKKGRLVAVLPQWLSENHKSFTFLYPSQRFASPKVQSFITLASATLAEGNC